MALTMIIICQGIQQSTHINDLQGECFIRGPQNIPRGPRHIHWEIRRSECFIHRPSPSPSQCYLGYSSDLIRLFITDLGLLDDTKCLIVPSPRGGGAYQISAKDSSPDLQINIQNVSRRSQIPSNVSFYWTIPTLLNKTHFFYRSDSGGQLSPPPGFQGGNSVWGACSFPRGGVQLCMEGAGVTLPVRHTHTGCSRRSETAG